MGVVIMSQEYFHSEIQFALHFQANIKCVEGLQIATAVEGLALQENIDILRI